MVSVFLIRIQVQHYQFPQHFIVFSNPFVLSGLVLTTCNLFLFFYEMFKAFGKNFLTYVLLP